MIFGYLGGLVIVISGRGKSKACEGSRLRCKNISFLKLKNIRVESELTITDRDIFCKIVVVLPEYYFDLLYFATKTLASLFCCSLSLCDMAVHFQFYFLI